MTSLETHCNIAFYGCDEVLNYSPIQTNEFIETKNVP